MAESLDESEGRAGIAGGGKGCGVGVAPDGSIAAGSGFRVAAEGGRWK